MLARLLDRLLHDLEFMAANIVLLGALGTAAFFHYVVHRVERWVHGLIRKVEGELHHIGHGLRGATVVIRKTITHVIMPGIKAATVAVPRYVHRELLRIRQDAQHAEKVALHALRAANKAEGKLASKPFALAVSAALATLGLDWLRCKSNPFHNNKNACGLWGLLEKLLGVVVSGLALENTCTLLPILETAFGAVVGPATHLLTEVPLGACEQPPKSWAQLSVAAGPLPPQQTLGTLPV